MPRLWRLVASLLAVTGLMGHGIAMLLVASLAPAPAEAAAPFYGEICSAAGSAGTGERAPQHPAGGLDACPVCTAFAHAGQGDLPSTALLPLHRAESDALLPAREVESTEAEGLAASPRAPPAA